MDPFLPIRDPPGQNVQAVSKQGSSRRRTTAAYWRSRLVRNSYTRDGRLHFVNGWAVKIQKVGRRRTFSLQATQPEAAAREALALYQSLMAEGDESALSNTVRPRGRVALAPAPISRQSAGPASRIRLVQRPYAPPSSGASEWSVLLEGEGHGYYFPLGTGDTVEAARRARRLRGQLRREGMAAVQARNSREVTVAIRWCADPVMWTYFSLHTLPATVAPLATVSPRPAPGRPFSVAVVEPDPGLRPALVRCLAAQTGCQVVAEWERATEVLGGLARPRVDLLLVSQTLDGISGADFLARLRLLHPRLASFVYSVSADSDELFKSTPGGAVGYLLRRTPSHRILEPLGDLPFPSPADPTELAVRVQRYFQRLIGAPVPSGGSAEMSRLTPRELEILGFMAKGFLDKEIAHELRISVWTVHGHAKKIFEKLGVHSRTEAVVKYLQK